MTEEQKESALIFLKGMVYNTDYNNSSNHYYKDILNIIEQQKKEIEKLKEENKNKVDLTQQKISWYYNDKNNKPIFFTDSFISKNEYNRVLNIINNKIEKLKHDYNLQLKLTYKRNKNLENQIKILEKIYEEINNG